jgi:UDP-N-acetylmuramoyl-L-alanyl-D-glutamate--2,6-diaminopimelate ligase
MHTLKDILYKVSLTSTMGDTSCEVSEIVFDSRKVIPNCVFIAVKGSIVDGHHFIDLAIANGAKSIVCENLPEIFIEGITYTQVVDSSKAMGVMASNFYGNPSEQLKLVAVTGTNGKTTSVTLLYQLFLELGYQVGLLSTVENKINEVTIPSTHTTPDAVSINQLLRQMVDQGCTHCFMEASSHAIVQERVSGLTLAGAVFSNISHDHLDYHGDFDSYIKAKKKLFDDLPKSAFALVNADDKRGMVMLQNCKANHKTFGLKYPGDFKAKIISNTIEGLELDIQSRQVWFRLIGEFNAYNLLGVFAVAVLLGEEEDEVLMQLSKIKGAQGRFSKITINGITAIVDYAHTPDALENVLNTLQGVRLGNEQIITVVGCGGNRDRTKRPVMAKIATQQSDKVILTSDNPRNEEPMAILKEMEAGVNPVDFKKTMIIEDRREAIKTAVVFARQGDIILIAGKGHETYQEIKGVKYPFNDMEIVKEILNLMNIN